MPSFFKTWLKEFTLFATKGLFVFLIVILIVVVGGNYILQANKSVTTQRTLPVEGTASVEMQPDTLDIVVGVTVTEGDPIEMQNNGNKQINDAVERLVASGITKEDIQTTKYQLNNQYVGNEYKLSLEINLAVKLKDLKSDDTRPGQVLKLTTEAGLNRIYGLTYSISNIDEVRESLKTDAINNAKEQKEELERSIGLRLGRVTDVSINGYYPTYYNDVSKNMEKGVALDSVSTPINIQIGKEKIEQKVTVYYEIL